MAEMISADCGIPDSIFCQGPILEAVQQNAIFPDAKTFVDMHLKKDSQSVRQLFESLKEQNGGQISRDDLVTFIKDNFNPPESEMDMWTPDDWVENPDFLQKIQDPDLREWGLKLHNLWRTLGRKISAKAKEDIKAYPDRYTLITVPHGFIIPGQRFREIYYWDTYWIIKGLLISGMTSTVKGMIENLLHLVDKYGKVPNGTRIYFLNRSQPPLLSMMMKAYYEATQDLDFVKDNVTLLEKEYRYWLNHHSVDITDVHGEKHVLSRYMVHTEKPRPEGYYYDWEQTKHIEDLSERKEMFIALATAAESGWDFSTRWFSHDLNGDPLGLGAIETDKVVPVCLNVYLGFTEKNLAEFHALIRDQESCGDENNRKAEFYQQRYEARVKSINALLWHEESGAWFDYHISNKNQRRNFYISNSFPLLFPENQDKVEQLVKYLKIHEVSASDGNSLPTSMRNSGEQWDFPNAWPPTLDLVVTALLQSSHGGAQEMARNLKADWLKINKRVWDERGVMVEKYSVGGGSLGGLGVGGEYEVQMGFGWSNGVILDYLTN